MAKYGRNKGKKIKPTRAKVIGFTEDGAPVCVKDGKIIIGDGCFEFLESPDGLEIEYYPDRCPTPVRDRFEGLLKGMFEKGKTKTTITKKIVK